MQNSDGSLGNATLEERWASRSFAVIDFETTGLQAHDCQAIEVGVVLYQDGQCVEVIETFLECKTALPKVITEITSITNEMLSGAPPFAQVFGDLHGILAGWPLVAFNAPFDRRFLTVEYSRIDPEHVPLEVPAYLLPEFKWIDPCTWSRALMPEHKAHKLGLVASRLGLKAENLHRAGDDAKLAGDVLLELIKLFPDRFAGSLASVIDKQELFAGQFAVRRSNGQAKAAVICGLCGESQPMRNGAVAHPEEFYCSVTCSKFTTEILGPGGSAAPVAADPPVTNAT